MYKRLSALVVVLTALAGCSTESRLYGDEPVVDKVENGMTKDQVLQIGGKPDAVFTRTAKPGTCFDYQLTKDGHKQPYNVSFNGAGKVDHTSFISCARWNVIQEKAKKSHKTTKQSGMPYY